MKSPAAEPAHIRATRIVHDALRHHQDITRVSFTERKEKNGLRPPFVEIKLREGTEPDIGVLQRFYQIASLHADSDLVDVVPVFHRLPPQFDQGQAGPSRGEEKLVRLYFKLRAPR